MCIFVIFWFFLLIIHVIFQVMRWPSATSGGNYDPLKPPTNPVTPCWGFIDVIWHIMTASVDPLELNRGVSWVILLFLIALNDPKGALACPSQCQCTTHNITNGYSNSLEMTTSISCTGQNLDDFSLKQILLKENIAPHLPTSVTSL